MTPLERTAARIAARLYGGVWRPQSVKATCACPTESEDEENGANT